MSLPLQWGHLTNLRTAKTYSGKLCMKPGGKIQPRRRYLSKNLAEQIKQSISAKCSGFLYQHLQMGISVVQLWGWVIGVFTGCNPPYLNWFGLLPCGITACSVMWGMILWEMYGQTPWILLVFINLIPSRQERAVIM